MERPLARPTGMKGCTRRIKVGCGWLYVTINITDEYKEVFVRLGKTGGCPASWCSSVGRLITFALEGKIPLERIIQALRGTECPNSQFHEGTRILSCADAIALALQQESTSQGPAPSSAEPQNPPV